MPTTAAWDRRIATSRSTIRLADTHGGNSGRSPFHDMPGIETVVDLQKPGMEEKMGQALVERMGRDDVACNLAATSMVTNTYICSGGDKYKSWVVEYTQVGIERTRQNNGILPANLASRARSANISTASGMMVTVVEPRRTVGTI